MGASSKHKFQQESGVNFGLFVIYLISSLIAATVILPNEENVIAGIIKSLVWPFYLITKLG
jgi:hypothetical protein